MVRFSTAGLIFLNIQLALFSISSDLSSVYGLSNNGNDLGTRPRHRRAGFHGYGRHDSVKYPHRHRRRRTLPLSQSTKGADVGKRADAQAGEADQDVHNSTFIGNLNKTGLFNQSSYSNTASLPEVAVSPGSIFLVQRGRTAEGSGRLRNINPYVMMDMEDYNATNHRSDSNIRQFSVVDAAFPAIANKRQIPPAIQHAFQQILPNASTLPVEAVATIQGQPSPFSPAAPYDPSSASTGYGDIITKSLWFYQVQRSGYLPRGPRAISWRNDSALEDGFDNHIDLTGGYYDAGDYLKFTHPLAYALTMLGYSGAEHSAAIAATGNIGYWDEMLRWGLDWLIKAHPDPNTLYVQVGDGDVDNNYWGGDLTIPTPRPSFSVSRSNPGTDVTAGAASAFAAGAIFYAQVVKDTVYAETLLSHALSLYYLAESASRRLYQASVPAVKEWYASTDYSDELCLGGLLLFRATSNVYFLRRVEAYFNRYKVGNNADPLDWDSKHGLCMLQGAQLVKQYGVNSTVDWKAALEKYLDTVALDHSRTPAGMLWWDGSSDTDSLSHVVSIAYLLNQYARTFPESSKSPAYQALADSQTDYVFGNNPLNMSYVVGVGDKYPKNPQSAMASGGNDIGNVDKSPLVMAHTLYGALVGGPSRDDSYQDKRSNWKQSECALDYNAALTALLASEEQRGRRPFFLRRPNET